MTDRLSVDPEALGADAKEFIRLANLGDAIGRDLLAACNRYAGCGGTGEMGETFNATYPEGERAGLAYFVKLAEAFGGDGERLAKAVKVFVDAEAETRRATKEK